MKFEREIPLKKEAALEKIPNKNEEIIAETPEAEEHLSPVEFNQELQLFHQNKHNSLEKINGVRSEIGIPEKKDDMPVELVQAEKHLKTLYNKLGKGDYVDFEKLKNDENANDVLLKNEAEKPIGQEPVLEKTNINDAEKSGERKLEPGDEVYSDGNFYKIYNIHTPTAEEEQKTWEQGKMKRDAEFQELSGRLSYKAGSDKFFEEGKLFEEQKRKELKERGPVISAIIKGGEEKIELDDRNIIKIETPEQREKIVNMQREADGAESRAAKFMGLSGQKKMVDKITGQPGKF